MLWQYSAIQAVPSACSSRPPVGSWAALRSKTAMLSSPRKPPSNALAPLTSLRLTHQVKLSMSLSNMSVRKAWSSSAPVSIACTWLNSVASAWTGGLTSEKFHSYAGIWPEGCR